MPKRDSRSLIHKSKSGFTLIEVMLVLGITGLMLVGVLGGTFLSISSQRYSDSLRGFAEYMRSIYSEVLSPQSLASSETADDIGNSSDYAILGKVIVFGHDGSDTIYSATLVGNPKADNEKGQSFIQEITNTDAAATNTSIFCGQGSRPSSVQPYTPLWEAKLAQANGIPSGAHYADPFTGTMIIARTPTSGTVHTIFAPGKTYDLGGDCASANTHFRDDLLAQHNHYDTFYTSDQPTGICVVSDNSAVHREVRIAADGRNTSAVWLRQDNEDNRCRPE